MSFIFCFLSLLWLFLVGVQIKHTFTFTDISIYKYSCSNHGGRNNVRAVEHFIYAVLVHHNNCNLVSAGTSEWMLLKFITIRILSSAISIFPWLEFGMEFVGGQSKTFFKAMHATWVLPNLRRVHCYNPTSILNCKRI